MNLQALKTRVRSLCDDPDATYITDDFLVPLVNQKYEEMYTKLLGTGSEFQRGVVVLNNVAAQTTDLSQYQVQGQSLEYLVWPIEFDYKQTGTTDPNYRKADLVDKVSDVTPGEIISDWEFRSGVIYFTPSTLAMDIRIRGDFLPFQLLGDNDTILVSKYFGHALAYGTAALVGTVRGNMAWQNAYKIEQDSAMDSIGSYLTRKDQGKIRRFGSMTRQPSRAGNYQKF